MKFILFALMMTDWGCGGGLDHTDLFCSLSEAVYDFYRSV